MSDFAKMIADVAAGKTEPADVGDMPAGQPSDPKREAMRERMAKARAARHKNTIDPPHDPVPADPVRSARAKEMWRKRRENQNGRAVAVPEPSVPKRTRRAQTGQAAVQGDDQGPGISSNGLSNVSRFGSGGGAGLPEAQPGTEAGTPDLQSRLAAVGLTPDKIPIAIQAAAQIGLQPFHINPGMFAQLPLEQALHLLDTIRAQTAALSQMLEERRQNEQAEDLTSCMWCHKPYVNGRFFARAPFEIPVGSGQWHSVHSCQSATCLGKYNEAVDKIQQEIRAQRAG